LLALQGAPTAEQRYYILLPKMILCLENTATAVDEINSVALANAGSAQAEGGWHYQARHTRMKPTTVVAEYLQPANAHTAKDITKKSA
jgi:hypothetical protein